MPRPRLAPDRLACWVTLVAALLAPPAFAAWPNTPNLNVPVCNATGDQSSPTIASMPSGATVMAWVDNRSGTLDIYVQKFSVRGVPLWAAGGVPVCTATGTQNLPVLVPDGTGGTVVVWQDNRGANQDIYAQRVDSTGTVKWTANGVGVHIGTGTQANAAAIADADSGTIVAYQYLGNIYVRHLNAAGALQWTTIVCTIGTGSWPALVSDGQGGAIVGWVDNRIDAGDFFAQRVNAAGVEQWALDGVGVGGDPIALSAFRASWLISDGEGGAIAAWTDIRRIFIAPPTFFDFYARRINALGTPQWAANGVLLGGSIPYTGAADLAASSNPAIVSNGAGGCIVAWSTRNATAASGNILVQSINAPGVAAWAGGGVALCTDAGDQVLPRIVSDGYGGAVVAWQDDRATTGGIYARRVNSAGVAQWAANGVPVSWATGNQTTPGLAPVGAGDGVAVWADFRNGATGDIYAQRISSLACLGADEPVLLSVRDVANDQGGQVRLTWEASCTDVTSPFGIESYWIWRQAPPLLAQAALARGARLRDIEDETQATRGELRTTRYGTTEFYWEYLDSQPAGHVPTYSYIAATTSDSVASSNPRTAFMVQARWGALWWSSNPDSGYSVDNLGPAALMAFTAQYFPGSSPGAAASAASAGYTWLHWSPSPEADFLEYRLHAGATAGFVPAPGNLVVAQADTGYKDFGTPGLYYKLLAVDTHGNFSAASTLAPVVIVGAETTPVRELWLSPGVPNPSRDKFLVSFGLPREAHVVVRIFDAAGRAVRTLVNGPMPAGPHSLMWDARDARGRLAPDGVYVTRLEAGGVVRQGKVVLAR